MLVLGQKKEPLRLVLREQVGKPGRKGYEPEAYIVLAPITPAMRRRAGNAARRLLGPVEDIEAVDFDLLADVAEAGSRELIRLGALEWGGIGDESGKPLDLTPDRETRFATANATDRPTGTIDQLLDDFELFARIEAEYVRPDSLRRAEKNGSSASPNGTGEAATRARTTASSHVGLAAPTKPTGGRAARKAKTRAAASARTASTRSRAKRAKGSGKP